GAKAIDRRNEVASGIQSGCVFSSPKLELLPLWLQSRFTMPELLMALIALFGLQGTGSLTGIVQTADGLAVPRFTLTIPAPNSSVAVVTDDAGRFRLAAPPDGD